MPSPQGDWKNVSTFAAIIGTKCSPVIIIIAILLQSSTALSKIFSTLTTV